MRSRSDRITVILAACLALGIVIGATVTAQHATFDLADKLMRSGL